MVALMVNGTPTLDSRLVERAQELGELAVCPARSFRVSHNRSAAKRSLAAAGARRLRRAI